MKKDINYYLSKKVYRLLILLPSIFIWVGMVLVPFSIIFNFKLPSYFSTIYGCSLAYLLLTVYLIIRADVVLAKRSDLEQKFNKLANNWREDTKYLSNTFSIFKNHNYLEIIKMGKDVLPFIFADLAKTHDHWYSALTAITGVDPIKKEHYGNLPAMANDWLSWAKKNNYIYEKN